MSTTVPSRPRLGAGCQAGRRASRNKRGSHRRWPSPLGSEIATTEATKVQVDEVAESRNRKRSAGSFSLSCPFRPRMHDACGRETWTLSPPCGLLRLDPRPTAAAMSLAPGLLVRRPLAKHLLAGPRLVTPNGLSTTALGTITGRFRGDRRGERSSPVESRMESLNFSE